MSFPQMSQSPRFSKVYLLSFLAQIDELKSCIEEREEELSRLKTGTVSISLTTNNIV